MKLSKENKQKILNEIRFVIEQMEHHENPESKLYYFSGIYGVLPRIFNFDFNEDLVFLHFVLSSIYNNIKQRMRNPDPIIKIPEELFDKLIETTKKLHDDIQNDKNLYDVLKKFTLLGYVMIGNGYYLYKKGLLKI